MNPIEPHADIRELAATNMQLYRAWIEQGFTAAQAMQLLVGWNHASIVGQAGRQDGGAS